MELEEKLAKAIDQWYLETEQKPLQYLQKKHTLFMTKMAKLAKIDTFFMTKTVENPYTLGPHILVMYSPYKGVTPTPDKFSQARWPLISN